MALCIALHPALNHRDVVNADIAGANICPYKSMDDTD